MRRTLSRHGGGGGDKPVAADPMEAEPQPPEYTGSGFPEEVGRYWSALSCANLMRDGIIAAEMERGSSSISVGKVMAGDERIN